MDDVLSKGFYLPIAKLFIASAHVVRQSVPTVNYVDILVDENGSYTLLINYLMSFCDIIVCNFQYCLLVFLRKNMVVWFF